MGTYQVAIKNYSKPININPHLADAYGNRCYALYLLKNYGDAITYCNKAIELKPKEDSSQKVEDLLQIIQKQTN